MARIIFLKINLICKKSKKILDINTEKIKVHYKKRNFFCIFLNPQVLDNGAGFLVQPVREFYMLKENSDVL